MKKIIIIFSAIALFMVIFLFYMNFREKRETVEPKDYKAADSAPNRKNTIVPESFEVRKKKASDYFPLLKNKKYIYHVAGMESFIKEVTVDYANNERIQQRIKINGEATVEVYEVKSGKASRILSQSEKYFRNNLLHIVAEGEIIIAEPIIIGNTWNISNGDVRMIINDEAVAITPSGNYKSIETVTVGDNYKRYDYYAKGLGLIKSKTVDSNGETVTMLSEIEDNSELSEEISAYYPDFQDMRVYRIIDNVEFRTNDATENILNEKYKDVLNKTTAELGKNIKINSIYVDQYENLNIDLNELFIKKSELSSVHEGMVLQSIANTFGKFFEFKKVKFTVENRDYKSTHINLSGQPITVSNSKNYARFYDVLVYGATPSGVMAAIAAAREGAEVAIIEPGNHIGGMITGGLCFSDYGNSSVIGGLARSFFEMVGLYYEKNISYVFEPHVAEKIMNDMIQDAGIKVYYNSRLKLTDSVHKIGSKIINLKIEDGITFYAQIFIDCTYEGDLMAMSDVSYTVGREGINKYDESLAGIRPPVDDLNFIYPLKAYDENGTLYQEISFEPSGIVGDGDNKIQSYNYRMCFSSDAANQIPFSKPENYDTSRYKLLAAWLNLLKENQNNRNLSASDAIFFGSLPNHKYDINNLGPISTDYVGGNWRYPEGDYELREKLQKEHKEYIQGLLYFLSTDSSVPAEIREEMRKYGYAADEFKDNNNWPYQLYIRESRRMIGNYVMTQKDLQTDTKKHDSIGMGSYNIDSHNVTRYINKNEFIQNEGIIQVPVSPYEIPYRSIVPKETDAVNLLVPVCISASHVAYSSIRMEPQYMILGEAAGIAAALSLKDSSSVQNVNITVLRSKLLQNHAVLELK